MKVLHVAETIKGGVASYLSDLLPCQEDDDRISSVIVLIPSEQRQYLNQRHNIEVFHGGKRGVMSLLFMYFCFVRLVLKEKPDKIHLHSTIAGGVCRLFAPWWYKKYIYCPHGVAFDQMRESRFKRTIGFLEYLSSHLCNRIVCISQYEKNELERLGVSPLKLVVVQNAIDASNLPIKKNISSKRVTHFLFVGRLDNQKGIDILLNAFQFDSSIAQLDVVGDVVVGSKESNSTLKKVNAENIIFHGWQSRDKVYEMMAMSDFLIVPSRWEGFGLVAAESIAIGTPVLASSAGALPEVVLNGIDGIIFDVNSIESLREAIMIAINKGGLGYIEIRTSKYRNYDIAKVNDLLYEVYK